jgi:hypothetical protein
MSTTVQGLRGTGQFGVDFRPKNYRELFTLLEPNGNAPLNALLSMTSSESTDDPEYKNFRDELPDRKLVVSGAIAGTPATGTAANITLTNVPNQNAFAVAGALVANLRTGEVMRVTADTTATTLAVTRAVGQATGVAINDADVLYIIGFAAQEGSNVPTPVSFDAEVATNYTQIFKTTFSVTGTQKETYLRTGDKLEEAMTKALKLHMSDIERAMFFGKKSEVNGSTAQPTRTTGGLINELTNVIDVATDTAVSGTMTEAEFDLKLIENVFAFGSKQKIAFVGARVAANLQKVAKGRWQPTQVEGSYGVNLTTYSTFAGDLMVHLHPQFRQITNMNNAMVIVDFPYLKYRFMQNRDTKLLENIQTPGDDQIKHAYMTECGLELTQSKVHTYIKGWNLV